MRDYRVAVRCRSHAFQRFVRWQQECLRGILFLEGYSRRGVLVLGCLVKGNLQGNDALWAEAIPLILMLLSLFGSFSTGRTNRHGDLLLGYYVRCAVAFS